MIKRSIIYGCEALGNAKDKYLTRYLFPRIVGIRMMLHVFHRSDVGDMHDHPWPFVTIILWRGYIEETPIYRTWQREDVGFTVARVDGRKRKRVWPGMILHRPADWVHRVELVNGNPAVTLVFTGKRIREWGFWTSKGFEVFRSYFDRMGC